MGQVTIYLDEGTLRKVKQAARGAHQSFSKWVKLHLEGTCRPTWPQHYFELFGSLAKEGSFKRPKQPSLSLDVRRQAL